MQKNKFSLVLTLIMVLAMLGVQPLAAKKKKKPRLSPKYQKWMDEVHYIITKTERKVFMQLKTDLERDVLIKAFWDHRDPTKGTPDNEFKIEHYKRFRHVKQTYGRSKTHDGWQTDRGKVYILLGQPTGIQRFTSYTRIYPTEVWHYQQAPKHGLPPAFNIVFFDRHNIGEYELYSPTADGPQKLLIGYEGKSNDYYDAYKQLSDFNSFLARTSLSLVPGEESTTGQPSMTSDFLLRNIEMAPKKDVSDLYARKYLKFKGLVEVEYSVNYTNSKGTSQVMKDEAGNRIFHYIIQLDKLSLDLYEDQYFTRIMLYGNLSDKAGKTIYQFEKVYNVKLNNAEFQDLQKGSFALSDQFPVIPGEYRLSAVLKNTNSKEFTHYETNITIPGATAAQPFYIEKPLLAYDVKLPQARRNQAPFTTAHGQLMIDPQFKFKRSDDFHVYINVHGTADQLKTGKIRLKFQNDKSFNKVMEKPVLQLGDSKKGLLVRVPLKDFPADYYYLETSLLDAEQKVHATFTQQFMITPMNKLPRPKVYSKFTQLNQQSLSAFILGTQYLNAQKPGKALPLMQKAFNLNPNVKRFALGLAHLYIKLRQYQKIEPLLTPFMDKEKPDYQVYYLLASVSQKLRKYQEAINYYRRLIAYHGSSTGVLNTLASCYYNLGQAEEARKAWQHSLKINPAQEKVKMALKGLKNEK